MEKYIIGALIGLGIAIALILLLHYTVFKDKKMWLLYVIMIILLTITGGFLQSMFFVNKKVDAYIPTPQEQLDSVTDTVTDTWKNGNGGFTFEQIQTAQKDDECPSYDDQVIKLTCYDFDGYVVFGFQEGEIYRNVLFYKSLNGLILDGVINTTASFKEKWHWCLDKFSYHVYFSYKGFQWNKDTAAEPHYYESKKLGDEHDNLVSLSRQSAYFVSNLNRKHIICNRDEAGKYALKEVPILTGQNATQFFVKFGEVELIGQANEGYRKINSFYNYLFEQIKGNKYDTSKIIDGTSNLCVPIPSEVQKNYPISQNKKVDYDNADFYGVYKCNIAVDLAYKKGNKEVSATSKNVDYVDKLNNDDDRKEEVIVDEVIPNYNFSKVDIQFRESQGSDLSKVDLMKTPVKLYLNCVDLGISKTLTINSFEKLNGVNEVLLNNNATWTYMIDCENLVFEDFRGSFSLNQDTTTIIFNYYYLDNFIIASVGLNPIGSIDKSKIDLSQNPVRIILSNDKQTYQFVFDNNSQLDMQKSMLVEMGKYSYTILSEQLIFASVTGSLTITTTDKVMLFNYALKVDQPLIFDIQMNDYKDAGYLHLYSLEKNVLLIRDTLSSNRIYMVGIYIYDSEGRMVENFSHTHSSTGNCADTWQFKYLTDGTQYTIQLRFASAEDSLKTYLSSITQFIYDSSKGFEVEYTATKNQ